MEIMKTEMKRSPIQPKLGHLQKILVMIQVFF